MKEKTIEGKKELAWAFYQVLGTFYGIHGPARIMNWLYDVAHGESREISELFPIRPEERAKYEWHGNDAAQPAPGWISVRDDLPKISGTYIGYFISGTLEPVHFNTAKQQWGNDRDGKSWNVTHWQPLPAPPEPAQEPKK